MEHTLLVEFDQKIYGTMSSNFFELLPIINASFYNTYIDGLFEKCKFWYGNFLVESTRFLIDKNCQIDRDWFNIQGYFSIQIFKINCICKF